MKEKNEVKLNELVLIGVAIENIHELTGIDSDDIVDALIDIAWDEQDANQIKVYAK